MAAVEGEQLLGDLTGDVVVDDIWGRTAWVRPAGCAVAHGESAELVRNLYAGLGQQWVENGCLAHFALVPTADPALLSAWFALSFGIEQVYSLLPLDELDLSAPPPAGVEIRRAGAGDGEALAEMSDLIWRLQTLSPVWTYTPPEQDTDLRQGYGGLVDDSEATVWLALQAGQALGFQVYYPGETAAGNLLVPERCVELSIAGTRPAARGRGIGPALTRHGLSHARAAGQRCALVDYRSTNLLASRFWPRQGFRPAVYRLVRRIDPRIAPGKTTVPETTASRARCS